MHNPYKLKGRLSVTGKTVIGLNVQLLDKTGKSNITATTILTAKGGKDQVHSGLSLSGAAFEHTPSIHRPGQKSNRPAKIFDLVTICAQAATRFPMVSVVGVRAAAGLAGPDPDSRYHRHAMTGPRQSIQTLRPRQSL
jgi:hypothetical protein